MSSSWSPAKLPASHCLWNWDPEKVVLMSDTLKEAFPVEPAQLPSSCPVMMLEPPCQEFLCLLPMQLRAPQKGYVAGFTIGPP